MNATLQPTTCRDCGSPLAENADQCEECGGSLLPGWFCWACREFNHPKQEEACARCNRPADNPKGWARMHRQKIGGAALLGAVFFVAAYCFIQDIRAGRNVLSQKDGEFSKQVREAASAGLVAAP